MTVKVKIEGGRVISDTLLKQGDTFTIGEGSRHRMVFEVLGIYYTPTDNYIQLMSVVEVSLPYTVEGFTEYNDIPTLVRNIIANKS